MHLDGFITRNVTQCTVKWTSKCRHLYDNPDNALEYHAETCILNIWMLLIKGCLNEKITPLNKYKYRWVFERHFTVENQWRKLWERKPCSSVISSPQILRRLRRRLNRTCSDEKPEINHLSESWHQPRHSAFTIEITSHYSTYIQTTT